MRLRLLLALLSMLALAAPHAHAAGRTDHWPATPGGALAERWVRAFGAGEDSMRVFLARDMARASLEERSVETRLVRYREMRENYGRFQLAEVVASVPEKLTVKLLDAKAKPYDAEFTFEPGLAGKLKGVTLRTRVSGGHSLFGGFHH